MTDTSQIALIRKLYDAMGDVNSFKSLLADDVEWDIEEGFPNGGVYRGIAGVFDFFTFTADFDEFYAEGDEYFESGDHLIVLGHPAVSDCPEMGESGLHPPPLLRKAEIICPLNGVGHQH